MYTHRLTEKVATLEDTLSHVEGDRASELSQLTAQLAEMSARCEEMDRERNDTQTTNREQVSVSTFKQTAISGTSDK